MPDTSISVAATVPVPAAVIFDLLASPDRHHEVDASGTVGADVDDAPITKTGQVFRMTMTYDGGEKRVEYQTDNHVTEFEPNRRIAWAVAPVGGEVLGWVWRWDLQPDGDSRSKVSLTYDWTSASAENQELYGVPVFDEHDLESSVKLLEKALVRS
ncbi:MAG: SRPBCC family protein [Marmoricola sp.]